MTRVSWEHFALWAVFICNLSIEFILFINGSFVSDINSFGWRSSLMDIWLVSSVIILICLNSVAYKDYNLILYSSLLISFIIFYVFKGTYYDNFDDTLHVVCYAFNVSLGMIALSIKIRETLNDKIRKKGEKTDHSDLEQSNPLLSSDLPGKKDNGPSLNTLLKMLQPEKWTLAVAIGALIVSTVCNLAQPYYFGKIISVCVDEGTTNRLNMYTEILVIINLIGMIASAIRGWLFTLVGERIVRDLRTNLFHEIALQDISFFDTNKTGELMNRLSSDTAVLQNALSVNISMGLRNFATIVASLVLLFVTSWKLTLVMMSVVPILVVSAQIYGRYTKKLTKNYQDALAAASDVGAESISNSRIMKSFGAENHSSIQYASEISKSYDVGAKRALGYGIFVGGLGTMANMAIIVVVYYGATLVLSGDMNVGALTAFVLYTIYIAIGMGMLGNLYADLMNAVGASTRIFEILETKPKINPTGGVWPNSTSGHIEFENVTFHYPARPDVDVLQNFNLSVRPNQTVALVGASGAGKSTVLCLLERFYDVISGRILVDGIDIRQLDPRYLHRVVSIVPQEPVLFSGTIRSNIIYAKLAANPTSNGGDEICSEEDVIEAARKANAHDFIMKFPEGYDTIVGERGVRLSGGQKQRVAIARALLSDPKILLLDEATSALDSESEQLVQEAIDRLMLDRTVIVIAHRLSTVKDANVIVVFSKSGGGKVVDAASHDVLLSRCEEYRSLVQRQLQHKSTAPEALGNYN